MSTQVLIIRTAGTNCERELAHGFELAGAQTRLVHLHDLIQHPQWIDEAAILALPGGFSYGDDIAAGRIFASEIQQHLHGAMVRAVKRGTLIIGICNGFQVLVKAGLLPWPDGVPAGLTLSAEVPADLGGQAAVAMAGDDTAHGENARQKWVTLADNRQGRFVDRWVNLDVPANTHCIWTKPFAGASIVLPIAHGEGRLRVRDPSVVDQLQRQGQVALAYDAGDDPNGSAGLIAGLCDPTGRVLGLMPHPERFTDMTHHPQWTRQIDALMGQTPAGLAILQAAVAHAASCKAASSAI